ncbi:MAG: carbohydrate binding domain-containing protein, partial [Planctomycetaceae bacterium]|nr:carbohydrate binding domain-containing protein [Planctomycetaceae bacterium]
AMLAAWQCRNYPLGEEMIVGGDFTKEIEFNKKDWTIQLDDAQQADCKVIPNEKLLRLTVHRNGKVSWTPQLYFRNLKLKAEAPYTLSFRVRSKTPFKINVSVYMDREPWDVLGMRSVIDLTPEWKTFTYRFYASQDCDFARVSFGGFKVGEFEFADVSLRSGGEFGLPENCSLEKGNVPLVKNTTQPLCAEAYKDFWRFLTDIEGKYWIGMHRYIRDDLKAKQPVSGTQLYYGSKVVQAALDYCDDHAYWNHPSWPNKPWDSEAWYIRNRALVNWADSDIFPTLGNRRIAGKPHTISEYNHPYPNQYAAEGLLMLSAFSQFQDWSGIFQYTYSHKQYTEPRLATGYFDMIGQQGQLVHSAACSNIIIRGDVSPAKQTVSGYLDPEDELKALAKVRYPSLVGANELGYADRRFALLHRVATKIVAPGHLRDEISPLPEEQSEFISDTKELTWNVGSGKPAERDAGYFTLNTPKTKVFTGFIKGREFNIGGVKLAFGKTRLDWATVSLTEVTPKRYLLAVSGYMENKGMKFEPYKADDPNNGDKMTLRKNWGTEPVMCEGVPLTLTLPYGKVKCFALDTAGNQKQTVPVSLQTSQSIIAMKPEYETLWYEIVLE